MEPDGCGAGIEGAGVGADNTLPEIGDLQPFVPKIMLDILRHRPIKKYGKRLVVGAEPRFDLGGCWSFANPQIAGAGGTKRIAQPADHIAHRAPTGHIAWSHPAHLGFATIVIVPKLDAGAIKKWHEETVERGGPVEASSRQVQLVHDQRMQKSGEISARRHAHAWKRLLYGAGPTYACTAFDHQDALTRTRKVGRASQPIMAGAHNNRVPGFGGEFADGCGQPQFTHHGGSW